MADKLGVVYEAMVAVFMVAVSYAALNQAMVSIILPMIDDVTHPQMAATKSSLEWLWYNWGMWAMVAICIYMIVGAMRKTTQYDDTGYYGGF